MTEKGLEKRSLLRHMTMTAGLIVGAISLSALSACSMVGLKPVETGAAIACRSSAGSYFLAKSKIAIKVTEVSETNVQIDALDVERLPDSRASYCLDFLGSPTSDDTLVVNKTENGLLDLITTSADDKSADIAKKLIEAAQKAAIGIGAARQLRSISTDQPVYIDSFDPFDPSELRILNHNLYDFGLCAVVRKGGEAVSMMDLSHDCTRLRTSVQYDRQCADKAFQVSNSGYCSTRNLSERDRALFASGSTGFTSNPLPSESYRGGILYRPRLPYDVYILRQKNRRAPGSWTVLQKKILYMENLAPVLSVGVDRTFFAKRETTLNFSEGMLQDVKVEKGSEFVGFVSIPLYLVNAIFEIPAQIIKLKIDQTSGSQKLVAAQQNLLEAQKAYDTAKANYLAKTNPPTAAGAPADSIEPDNGLQ